MDDLYRLRLMGITYNQIESGVYALILEEEKSGRRLPIIIGYPEAQAIECKLQDIRTPRPLTHDLMATMLDTFGIRLKSVVIKRLPTGVFAADLTLESEGTLRTVDSRSSDAIALAIRTGAPIFTTYEVLEESSYSPEERKEGSSNSKRNRGEGTRKQKIGGEEPGNFKEDISEMDDDRLRTLMQKAVETEDYEEAARIKKELDRRSDPEASQKE